MVRRSVAGRTYVDPDVVSIIDDSGGLLGPPSLVRSRVCALLKKFEQFEFTSGDPFQRVCMLASLAGFEVQKMEPTRASRQTPDAVIVPTSGNRNRGVIFYNPNRHSSRIVFSIAHEIIHSFFPTSHTGARFRALSADGSKGSLELEMLCHLGASELTMPREAFLQVVDRIGFGMSHIDKIRGEFGTSFEACLYRLAATARFPAAAGLAKFKLKRGEEEALSRPQRSLFKRQFDEGHMPQKKYRRQSFHKSDKFPEGLTIHWNKSFPEDSCVYRASLSGAIKRSYETIPLGRGKVLSCLMESVIAPFQPDDVDADRPDVFFLLRLDCN